MAVTNLEAQQIIDHTLEREKHCKFQLLSEIFNTVNSICRQEGLEYFALGKLLAICLTGDDYYYQDYQYDIGMLRQDYDCFLAKLHSVLEGGDIRLKSMYHPNGALKRMTAYLVKQKTFHIDDETIDTEVRLYIQPFEILPSNKEEYNRFLVQVSEKSCEYSRLSKRYRFLRRDTGSLKANPLRVPGLIKNKIAMGRTLQRKRKEYYRLSHKYSGLTTPQYMGRVDFLQYSRCRYHDIFPVGSKSVSGMQIMIPAHPEQLAIFPEKQERQRVLEGRLKGLDYFDRLCREHDLSYVAMEELAVAASHDAGDEWAGLDESSWKLGMLREDYEKALDLMNVPDSPVRITRSLEHYSSICGYKVSFCMDGYEKQIPQQNSGSIFLYPIDALPLDYEEKLSFSGQVREMSDLLQKKLRYEKGLDYKQPEEAMDSWKLYEQMQKKCMSYNGEEQVPEQLFTVIDHKMVVLPYAEIFPTLDKTICGQVISCAHNPFFWHVKKDQAYTEYLADKREKVMGIIDDIAVQNQINYFAMSNLLIGAVIYHDVMPQSDQRNMDIGFLRKDYEAFIRLIREKGEDYGIELHESMDGNGKYPLGVKYITLTGEKYSQARVRPLPFDKVPEDFYLYHGLRDEIDQKNENYNRLLNRYNFETKSDKKLPASMDEELRYYLEHADAKEEAAKIEELAQSFHDDERTSSYMWIAFGKSKTITEEELFPLQRVAFRDIFVNCPRDTSVWQPVLDKELERQVSCIQRADLLLLKEFDRICRKLDLGYFVCGGTMLGYMRHKGFIPWDDDVDVAMLRKDYDRFIKEAGPLLPDRFFLQTRETDPNIPYLFSKIRLDDTEYITKYNEKRDFHKGICLDIFPFDYLPREEGEQKRFIKEVKELAKEHHRIAGRQFPIPEEECIPRNDQERKYIEEQKSLLESYWAKDLAVSQKAYLDAATRYNDQAEELGLRTVASFVPSYTFIDLNDLLPYQRGQFEDIEVSVPKRPDIFLKMQYGDYMQMPPKHMQVAHRLLKWSTWEARGSASGIDTGTSTNE